MHVVPTDGSGLAASSGRQKDGLTRGPSTLPSLDGELLVLREFDRALRWDHHLRFVHRLVALCSNLVLWVARPICLGRARDVETEV